MNIEEAIEIKGRTGEDFLNTDPDEIDEADRLSIEALKRLQEHRSSHPDITFKLLPGETED